MLSTIIEIKQNKTTIKTGTLFKDKRMLSECLRNQQDSIYYNFKGVQSRNFSFEKRAPTSTGQELSPREMAVRDSFRCAQLSSRSEAAAAMVQPGHCCCYSRPGCFSCDATVATMENARVMGLGNFFQI